MSISKEIKSMLLLKNLKKNELQEFLKLGSPQALTNKFARNSWSAAELIRVVNFLGGELIVKLDDREIVLKDES